MKIAIIGSGNVGGTLGLRWAALGHDVVYGVRDPESRKVKALLSGSSGNISALPIKEAALAAPVVVLAVPWAAARKALEAAGDLSDKVVIDCTNPVKEGLAGLPVGSSESAAEQISAWCPGANVVKAFSTTGSANMKDPSYGENRVSMFICGDNNRAKEVVGGLAGELGFEVVDTGALRTARYLEPLAMLWIHLAYNRGMGPDIAFKLMKRSDSTI